MLDANAIFNRVIKKYRLQHGKKDGELIDQSEAILMAGCVIAEALKNGLDETNVQNFQSDRNK